LGREERDRLAAKEAWKKLSRRALLHAMRREPPIGPSLEKTRDNEWFARAKGVEGALREIDESSRREGDIRKGTRNTLSIDFSQVTRIYTGHYSSGEKRLDFEARHLLHRRGGRRAVKRNGRADKSGDAGIGV